MKAKRGAGGQCEDPQPTHEHRWLWVAPTIAALSATVLVAVPAFRRPEWSYGPGAASWWQAAPDNWLLATSLVALWGLSVATYWSPRRRRPLAFALVIIGGLGALAMVLGTASYLPCADGQLPVLAPVTWAALLFVGNVEGDAIGPGSVGACRGTLPLALQLARVLALSATAVGFGAAALAVSRQQVDKLSVRWARDVDVVVGLDATTVPLVDALVQEARDARNRPAWYDETLWERLRPRRLRRVVVLHNNAREPLLGEIRAIGARVIVADPTLPEALRPALTSKGRVSMRRVFAVSADQEVNLRVWRAATTVLQDVKPDEAGGSRQTRNVVPRLVVRFDDPREARDWRIAHACPDHPWFDDALSVDDLLARGIVRRLREANVTTLVLAGDTPLAVAVLGEIRWLRTCEHELAGYRRTGRDEPWSLASIRLVGPTASRVKTEWDTHRPPTPSGLALPTVSAEEGDWELLAAAAVRNAPDAAVVVVDPPSADALTRATRIARSHPGLVIAPDQAIAGVSQTVSTGLPSEASRHRAVVRYGATLLQGKGAPEDSWTVLVRQQHAWYAVAYPAKPGDKTASRREWGEPGADECQRLPEFYREDNLQQHRKIMSALSARGWTWTPAGRDDSVPAIPPETLEAVARDEHERWYGFRRRHGWREPVGAERERSRVEQERSRLNGNVREWADDMCGFNTTQVAKVVEHLYWWGVRAFPDDPSVLRHVYRRCGEVVASKLEEEREWRTAAGDLLHAKAGDWWVVDPDGTARSVDATEFGSLYEHVAGDRYRRIGVVRARQVVVAQGSGPERDGTSDGKPPRGETIPTLEGAATAKEGMWVVTDTCGHSWPVPDAEFVLKYEPVDD